MHSLAQDIQQADQMAVKHYHKNTFVAPTLLIMASTKLAGCVNDAHVVFSGYRNTKPVQNHPEDGSIHQL